MTQKPDVKISIPASFFTAKELSGIKEKANSITLRDYFAGHALVGILAGGFADTIPHDDVTNGTAESPAVYFAYLYADAMIAAKGEK